MKTLRFPALSKPGAACGPIRDFGAPNSPVVRGESAPAFSNPRPGVVRAELAWVLCGIAAIVSCGAGSDKGSHATVDGSDTDDSGFSAVVSSDQLVQLDDYAFDQSILIPAIGDLSADSVADLVIGAPGSYDDGDGETQGELLFYAGPVILNPGQAVTTTDLRIRGRDIASNRDSLGVQLATIDVDDGLRQLLVVGSYIWLEAEEDSAPIVEFVDVDAIGSGAAYMDAVRATISHGATPVWRSDFGHDYDETIFGTGDFNGDGVQDLTLSMAIGVDPGDTSRLSGACVYFGPVSGEIYYEDANFVLWDNNDFDENRLSEGVVQMDGDFNGDGYDDLLTGATLNSHTPDWDNISITFGSSMEDDELFDPNILIVPKNVFFDDAEATNVSFQPYFGCTARYVGDWDGDNHQDIAVGACGAGTWDGDEGAVYVFGDLDPGTYEESAASTVILGDPYDNLGEALTTVGDLWGDQSADILVGGLGDSTRGAALFSGGSGHLGIDDAKVVVSTGVYGDFDTPEGAESMVSGDLDGDGLLDTVIGGRSGAHFILPGALLAE